MFLKEKKIHVKCKVVFIQYFIQIYSLLQNLIKITEICSSFQNFENVILLPGISYSSQSSEHASTASLKPVKLSMSNFLRLTGELPKPAPRFFRTLSIDDICQSRNFAHRSSRWMGDNLGLRAAKRHRVTISSQKLAAACWEAFALLLLLLRLPWLPLPLYALDSLVANHQTKI